MLSAMARTPLTVLVLRRSYESPLMPRVYTKKIQNAAPLFLISRHSFRKTMRQEGQQLATLNVNNPRFYCLLRKEFLYDGQSHQAEFVNVCGFGVASIKGHALGFHALTDNGRVIWRLPLQSQSRCPSGSVGLAAILGLLQLRTHIARPSTACRDSRVRVHQGERCLQNTHNSRDGRCAGCADAIQWGS